MRWIQQVQQRMQKKGTIGAFRKQAERAGMTTLQFAKHVLKNPHRYRRRTVLRARLALTLAKLRRKR